jgi:hypothetical protein
MAMQMLLPEEQVTLETLPSQFDQGIVSLASAVATLRYNASYSTSLSQQIPFGAAHLLTSLQTLDRPITLVRSPFCFLDILECIVLLSTSSSYYQFELARSIRIL